MLRPLLIRVMAPLLSSISLDRFYVIVLSLSQHTYTQRESGGGRERERERERSKEDTDRFNCQFLGRTIMIGFALLFISLSRSLSVIGHCDLSLWRESSPSWESRSIWITTKGIAAGKRIALRSICHRQPGGWACCVTVTWPGKRLTLGEINENILGNTLKWLRHSNRSFSLMKERDVVRVHKVTALNFAIPYLRIMAIVARTNLSNSR